MSSEGGAAAGSRDAFLRAVLERSPALSAVVGADGRFSFVSASAEAILGRSPEEVTGLEKPLELVHPEDR